MYAIYHNQHLNISIYSKLFNQFEYCIKMSSNKYKFRWNKKRLQYNLHFLFYIIAYKFNIIRYFSSIKYKAKEVVR